MRLPVNGIVRVLIAVTVLSGRAYGQGTDTSNGDVAVLTVCEALENLNQLNGKNVVLVGKLVSTMEGQWLSQECKQKLVTVGYTWMSIISLTYVRSTVNPPSVPGGFKWDVKLLQEKLHQVQKTTKLEVLKHDNYPDKWFAILGRFETRIPPQVAIGADGRPHGNGFGHMGAAPARLVSDQDGKRELKPGSN